MFHNLWRMLRTSEGCDAFDELDANECRKMEDLGDIMITNVSKDDMEYSAHDGSAESPIIQANWDTHPLLAAISCISDTEEGRLKTAVVAEEEEEDEEVTEAQTVVSEEVTDAKITWDESNSEIQQEEDTFFDTSEDKMEATIGESANDNQNLLINLELDEPLKDSAEKPSESTLKADSVFLGDLMGGEDLQRLKKETRLLIRNQKVKTKTVNNWISSSPASVGNQNSLEQNNMETKIQDNKQLVNISTPAVKDEERVPTPKDISSDDDTSDYWSTSSSHMALNNPSPPPTAAMESISKNTQNGEDDDDSYRPMYKTYTESVVERDIRMAKEREEELRKDRLLALSHATASADQTPGIVANKKMDVPIEPQQDVTKIVPEVNKNSNEATHLVDLNVNQNASAPVSVENRNNNAPTPLVIKANTESLQLSDKNVRQLLAFIEMDGQETNATVRKTTEEEIPKVKKDTEVIPVVKINTEVIPVVKTNTEEVMPVEKNTEDAIAVLNNDALKSPSAIIATLLPVSQKDTQRRMASSRIQQEIEEQMKREIALRDEGIILTTSLETVDAKAAQIGEAVRAEAIGYSSVITRHIQENETATAFPFAPQPPDSPNLLSPSFATISALSSLSPVPSPPESVTSDDVPSTPSWGSSARREAFANSTNNRASLDNSGATNRKGIMSKFIASGGRMVLNPTMAMPRAPAPDNQSLLHTEVPSLPDISSAIQGKPISPETNNAPVNNAHAKVQAPRKNPPKSSPIQSRMDEEIRQMRLRESELRKRRNRDSILLELPNANKDDAVENTDMDSGPSSSKPTLLIAQWEEMIQQSSEC